MSFIEKTLYDEDGNPFQVQVPAEPQAPQVSDNVRQMREQIKALEAEAAKNKELESKVQNYERSETIRKAGLELDETQRRALEAAHAGEWSPEAVRQTAVTLKWADPPAEGANADEQAAHGRMNAAINGSSTTPPDPEADLNAKLANAASEKEFLEIYRNSGRPIATD